MSDARIKRVFVATQAVLDEPSVGIVHLRCSNAYIGVFCDLTATELLCMCLNSKHSRAIRRFG